MVRLDCRRSFTHAVQAVIGCVVLFGAGVLLIGSAQSPCPDIPIDNKGWPEGTTVYYQLDQSVTNCNDQKCAGQ